MLKPLFQNLHMSVVAAVYPLWLLSLLSRMLTSPCRPVALCQVRSLTGMCGGKVVPGLDGDF